jgi:hypothetical protein
MANLVGDYEIDVDVMRHPSLIPDIGMMKQTIEKEMMTPALKMVKLATAAHDIHQTILWTSALEIFLCLCIIVVYDTYGG